MSSVDGKVALITGGGSGIGAEVARRLHDKGARLVLVDLDEAALAATVAELDGARVLTVRADVRDLAAMQSAVDRAVERFGGIDVVVANAGVGSFGSLLQVDPEAFKRVIDVNVLGVFHTVRAALPAVIDRRGYILIVSSLAAYSAAAGFTAYNTSKAAAEHFANTLRLEVTYRGVTVGSAHMSWIDTPMLQEAKTDSASFRDMLRGLPGPLGRTISVSKCGEAFVAGIEGRKRRINCPRWVGAFRWLRPLLSTPVGEAGLLKPVADLLPRMDAEVVALGRSASARIEAVDKQ